MKILNRVGNQGIRLSQDVHGLHMIINKTISKHVNSQLFQHNPKQNSKRLIIHLLSSFYIYL